MKLIGLLILLFLFVAGCKGDSADSNADQTFTLCQDVEGLSNEQVSDILDVADDAGVDVEQPGDFEDFPPEDKSLKLSGPVVVQCGGTLVNTETSSVETADALKRSIKNGDTTKLSVR